MRNGKRPRCPKSMRTGPRSRRGKHYTRQIQIYVHLTFAVGKERTYERSPAIGNEQQMGQSLPGVGGQVLSGAQHSVQTERVCALSPHVPYIQGVDCVLGLSMRRSLAQMSAALSRARFSTPPGPGPALVTQLAPGSWQSTTGGWRATAAGRRPSPTPEGYSCGPVVRGMDSLSPLGTRSIPDQPFGVTCGGGPEMGRTRTREGCPTPPQWPAAQW